MRRGTGDIMREQLEQKKPSSASVRDPGWEIVRLACRILRLMLFSYCAWKLVE